MRELGLTSTETNAPHSERLDGLIKRIAGGERQALGELYGDTHAAVYGFALSFVRNHHDAEDILQDVYIKLWSSAGSYRARGHAMAWILTVTKNLSLDRLREKKKTADISDEEWQLFAADSPSVTSEDRLVLTAALSKLCDGERQILMLHASAGLKHREIAEVMGLPLATVLSKYSRAKSKLRGLLREEDRDE